MKEILSEKANAEKKEVNLQAELGKLLQAKRPPEVASEIEKIIQGSHSIEDKIKLIKKLEKPVDKSFLNRRDLAASVPDAQIDSFDVSSIKVPSFSDLHKARNTIKSSIIPSSIGNYLFREFPKIKFFGAMTHVISRSLLFFRLRLDPDLPFFLISHIQKELCVNLAPGLRYILEHGWLFLKKEQYNALHLLNLFVGELLDINFSKLNFKNRYLIDNLKKMESLYLSILSIPDGISNLVMTAVGNAYIHIPTLAEKHPRMEHYINLLFSHDATLPSFTNFILGANMIKYRRFIGYGDLIRINSAPVISDSDWECKVNIYREIQKHLWEQEQQIKPMLHYYDEVFRLANYIPVTIEGEIDYSSLITFWDSYFEIGHFNSVSQNISAFSQRICELILGPVQELLTGEITCEEVGTFSVFAERTFSSEFFRIETVRDSLIKLAEIQTVFTRDRFIQLKRHRKGSIPNEAAFIQKISILLSAVLSIANEIIATMKGRLKSYESVESYPLIDSLMIRKGSFFLPHENNKIIKPKCYAEKTLPEALHLTITNILSLSVLLDDQNTTSLLIREKKLKQKIIETGLIMKRLANATQFPQFQELYQLDLFGL